MVDKVEIRKCLADVGVPCIGSGHVYLTDALTILLEGPNTPDFYITKVYQQIADMYGRNADVVARAIRHTVESTVLSMNESIANKHFMRSPYRGDKITAKEFITAMVVYLKEKGVVG